MDDAYLDIAHMHPIQPNKSKISILHIQHTGWAKMIGRLCCSQGGGLTSHRIIIQAANHFCPPCTYIWYITYPCLVFTVLYTVQ